MSLIGNIKQILKLQEANYNNEAVSASRLVGIHDTNAALKSGYAQDLTVALYPCVDGYANLGER